METECTLYRGVRKEEFPEGPIKDDKPVQGVLYPSFEEHTITSAPRAGQIRAPDVTVDEKTGFVHQGRGTSTFDRDGVFGHAHWFYFEIPEKTPYPACLKVVKGAKHARFNATHYQIEPAHGRLRADAYKGALDNFARNAVERAYSLARSGGGR